jgi:hypothetical protein
MEIWRQKAHQIEVGTNDEVNEMTGNPKSREIGTTETVPTFSVVLKNAEFENLVKTDDRKSEGCDEIRSGIKSATTRTATPAAPPAIGNPRDDEEGLEVGTGPSGMRSSAGRDCMI